MVASSVGSEKAMAKKPATVQRLVGSVKKMELEENSNYGASAVFLRQLREVSQAVERDLR